MISPCFLVGFTNSVHQPCGDATLLIESKAFLKSTNVITAGKLLALICSIILLSVKISAVVDLPGLNPFWFVRSNGSGWAERYLRASLCKILISSFGHKTDFASNFCVDFF